jgi:hypothetical protein
MGEPTEVPTADLERTYEETFAINATKRYLVQNRTPHVVHIRDVCGELVLAPLAQRVMTGKRLAPFEARLRPFRQRHQLRVRQLPDPKYPNGLVAVGVVLVVLSAMAAVAYDLFVLGTLVRPEMAVTVAVLVAVVLGLMSGSARQEELRLAREDEADTDEGDIEFGVGGTYFDGNETARRTKQMFTLLMVVVIGAVLPAMAIFVATDANQFIEFKDGLRVKDGLESRLVSRVIVATYTAVLALFPALMYFQFDQQRVGTIRGKWVRAIFRMDPQMQTLADVDARYGDQLAEASSYSTDSVRLLGGRHSPIVIATILISLGWTALVLRTESFDFAGGTEIALLADAAEDASQRAAEAAEDGSTADLAARADAAETAAADAARANAEAQRIAALSNDEEPPPAPVTDRAAGPPSEQSVDEAASAAAASAAEARAAERAVQQPYLQLLVPKPSTAAMAFLGAYFFAVYLVLRGYFSGDLRPKIYNQITARLVTVVILAYLLTVVYAPSGEPNRGLWTMAFLAGVVPTTVLQRFGDLKSSLLTAAAGGDVSAESGGAAGSTGGGDGGGPPDAESGSKGPRKRPLRAGLAKAFVTQRPLTQVDGIDIYESARLESEGISDIPALAKSDLVSMMVNTRLPVERLVDWTDQAMLILLVDDGPDDEPGPRVRELRGLGVRTASRLLDIADSQSDDGLRKAVERALGNDGAVLLQGLARQIRDEPSIRRVRHWYDSERRCLDRDRPTIGKPRDGAADHDGKSGSNGATAPAPAAAGDAPSGDEQRVGAPGGR